MHTTTTSLTIFALFSAACQTAAAPDPAGAVPTASGWVSGVTEGDVTSFKGVPYAAPPVGERRWRPPEPAPAWDGVLPATGFGYACMQPATSGDPESTPIGSEDCLTLNVWTPEARSDAARPVLVFVHGGYFTWGSSSRRSRGVDLYDGAELARRGDVVVVTMNYRLGALGFIGHPALAAESPEGASGNYGLLDQIAALEWVQANIDAFGGDPGRVLLLGQSAGAISTAALYASPLARGLFSAALLHSGSAGAHPRAESEGAGLLLASTVGCDAEEDELACLRARSASEIVAALPESLDGGYGFAPNVDGWVLPDRPLTLVESGLAAPVPLVVGVTADEYTTMIENYIDAPIDSEAAYLDFLRRRFGQAAASSIAARYPATSYPSPRDALIAFFGDVVFICPSRRLARAASAHAPVRRFVYTHTYSSGPAVPLRAGHGLELPFLFRNFLALTPTAAELGLSDEVIAAWSRFAATGDPSGAGLEWPEYEPVADPHLVLDTPISRGSGFRRVTCDYLDQLAP